MTRIDVFALFSVSTNGVGPESGCTNTSSGVVRGASGSHAGVGAGAGAGLDPAGGGGPPGIGWSVVEGAAAAHARNIGRTAKSALVFMPPRLSRASRAHHSKALKDERHAGIQEISVLTRHEQRFEAERAQRPDRRVQPLQRRVAAH